MDAHTPTVSIPSLLKKTEHYDKDERYMATSDLCEVLKKKQMDIGNEKNVCTAVLRLLHDKSNDVQAIAVKTLGVLLTTVQEDQVLEIADSLTDQVLDSSKSELRDVYAIGLRTLCKTVPLHMGQGVSKRILGRLLDGIRTNYQEEKDEIALAGLDILADMLGRFTSSSDLRLQHEPTLQICLHCLGAPRQAVRKRAGATMGVLATVLSDTLLENMIRSLLAEIEKKGTAADTRALIRAMCTVSGAVGHRLNQDEIDAIAPIFLRFTDPQQAITGDDDHDDDDNREDEDEAAVALANELRESCFMGFESFILRCPTQVGPHLHNIIQAALAFMSYDPNYSYGEDADENGGGDEEIEDYGDDDEDGYSDEYESEMDEDDDDDDESWKVRRGAIRTLKACVECKHLDPTILWKNRYSVRGTDTTFAEALVNRFKEREENCRVGVLDCFNRLLEVSVESSKAGVISLDVDGMSDADGIDLHGTYADKLVKACDKVMALKVNERSKSSAMALLATLCSAPGGVGGQEAISRVFDRVQAFLTSSSNSSMHRENVGKALQLDSILLVSAMLSCESHHDGDLRKALQSSLLPALCDAVNEQWYKVIAEALRALTFVPGIFHRGFEDDGTTCESEKSRVAELVYTTIEPVLASTDVDQEIKECALSAMASLLVYLHGSLKAEQMKQLLKLLLDRLGNETTRISAMRTLLNIAKAEDKVDLTSILTDATATIVGFLKLQSRSSKQSALEALNVIVKNHGSHDVFADGSFYTGALQEFVIDDTDLHLSHLALRVSVSILSVCPTVGEAIRASVLPQALKFATSSLVEGPALETLLSLFRQVVESSALPYGELLGLLCQCLEPGSSKHAVYNLAKCGAVVATSTSAEDTKKVLEDAVEELKSIETPEDESALKRKQFLLLQTGNVGASVGLDMAGVEDQLKSIYIGYFDSSSEELKSAAAHALGTASVGAQKSFLPAIVRKLEEDNQKQHYLLLSSMREYIQSCSSRGHSIVYSIPVILPTLEKHCADKEEGLRAMVAECLGSLTVQQPVEILQKLGDLLKSHSAISTNSGLVAEGDSKSLENSRVCSAVITSVKNAISSKVDPAILTNYISGFLVSLRQEELQLRLAALQMVYSALYHCPQVVASTFRGQIAPTVYEVSGLVMKRKVDLGPFTHTVDEALQLRTTCLSILSTCLEKLPGCVDISQFVPVLAKALGDAEDVQLQAHQIVISLCTKHPLHIVKALDSFVDPLEKTTNKKAGQKSGTELERFKDWIKSALRVTLTIAKLDGAASSRKFTEFVDRVKNNPKHSAALTALGEEK